MKILYLYDAFKLSENEKTLFIKWLATILTLIGAVLTSLKVDPLNIYFLNAGSALFLWWGFRIHDKAMICVNAGLLTIYLLGILLRI